MKVSGDATLHAPVERVFAALNDPAVLVRTIPGCERLEQVGEDAYRMTVSAGVASIKGSYDGDVRITEQQVPTSFRLRATGAGAPGTVTADVLVSLVDDGGSTRLRYDADAVVGGMVGGVGQRILAGVARRTAGEFFAAVDDVLTGAAPRETVGPGGAVGPAGPPPTGTAASAPTVFTRTAAARGGPPGGDFALGALFGATVALAGALVGGYITRRR